jgi:hypothetical protein
MLLMLLLMLLLMGLGGQEVGCLCADGVKERERSCVVCLCVCVQTTWRAVDSAFRYL